MSIDRARVDAVIFDMDGVLTDTASVHASAWTRLFDAFLEEREGGGFRPFSEADYRRYVDGKPRYDGVASFLASRGIELPRGEPDDPPGAATVCGLGNAKNAYFHEEIERHGVDVYPSSLDLLDELSAAGIRVAVISASRNAERVLSAGGILERFDVRVDGSDQAELGFAGKPEPAVFLEAASRLGVAPRRAVVVEDALAGVEAGRRGDFGLVVGVDRTGHADELRASGADIVVSDLSEVTVVTNTSGGEETTIAALPSAVEHRDAIAERFSGRRAAVFLDYDGTLTPIVEEASAATIDDATRTVIRGLAAVSTVAVVSGRDLDDVREMVGVDEIHYAGSHGFDILAPDGSSAQKGREFLADLDAAEEELRPRLAAIPEARVERKRFAIAVHFRQVEPGRTEEVRAAVEAVATEQPRLRTTGGKMVLELRPDLDWDKGRALRWLLDELDLDRPDVLPVYVGDDVTDEDAFRELRGRGLGVVVRGEDDERATLADFALADPAETVRFLDDLRRLLEDRG